MERLQSGDCGIEGGIALVDLVTSFERISSHCSNISLHVIKRVENDRNFDEMHGHANDSFSEEYKALYHYYESQYITPVFDAPNPSNNLVDIKPEKTEKIEKINKLNKPAKSEKPNKSEKTGKSEKAGKTETPKKISGKHSEKEPGKHANKKPQEKKNIIKKDSTKHPKDDEKRKKK